MSYTKQQFRQGDILRASQLNIMDDQIAALSEQIHEDCLTADSLKTINGQSLIGSGDIVISGGEGGTSIVGPQGPKGDDGTDGVSITSVIQTTTSSADGGTNVVTVTLSNGTTSTFNVKNGSKGSNGSQGPKGDDGIDGVTFTPSVDSAGNLSWTNNGGLTNPSTVNIKGPKGDAGSGGSGDDNRYFTDFTVETVMDSAQYSTNISCNVDALIEAARANKLICVPYANADSGYVVASYSFTDGGEYDINANFSINEGGALYYFYITYTTYAGGENSCCVKGDYAVTLSPYIGEIIEVEGSVAYVTPRDNSIYTIFDAIEELYVWPEGYLTVGTTIRFLSGENLTIEISDCIWANGVIPIIEPNTIYELSITTTNDGYMLAVLTPFKLIE